MANVINVNQTEDTIEVEVGTDEITIEVGAISNMQAFVESDVLFPLNGDGGNTGFKFNSTTGKVEIWVDGVKQS